MVAAGFFYGSVVPERLGNCYGEVTWSSILVLWGFLDSNGQESPIGISTGAQVSYGVQQFLQKGGRKISRVQGDDTSLTTKEYLGLRYWKVRRVTLSTDRDLVVLSSVQWRFGPGFHGYMVLWIPLWIFKDNYNCNGNNNGNSNDGETL